MFFKLMPMMALIWFGSLISVASVYFVQHPELLTDLFSALLALVPKFLYKCIASVTTSILQAVGWHSRSVIITWEQASVEILAAATFIMITSMSVILSVSFIGLQWVGMG